MIQNEVIYLNRIENALLELSNIKVRIATTYFENN